VTLKNTSTFEITKTNLSLLHKTSFISTVTILTLDDNKKAFSRPIRHLTKGKVPILNIIDLRLSELSTSLKNLKQNRYFHKREDYFVLIIEERLHEIKHEDSYMLQIQHKVAISFQDKNIRVKKFCCFCNSITSELMTLNNSVLTSPQNYLQTLFPNSIKNFKGKQFRVVISYKIKVRTSLIPQRDGSWNLMPGVFRDILTLVKRRYNFTILYLPTTGGYTGSKLPNGTWIGTVGDVYNEKGEIGCFAGNVFNRFPLVDLTTPVEYHSMILITGKHFRILSWQLLSAPLSNQVWIYLLIATTFMAIFIYLVQSIYKTI
jgi:hypothetical protein